QFREFRPALAVFGELEFGTQQLGAGVDEGGPVALDQIGGWQRAIELGQLRLVIKQLQVRRGASHEEKNGSLGARGVVRRARCQWIGDGLGSGCGSGPWAQQLVQGDGSQTDAALLEKPAPG